MLFIEKYCLITNNHDYMYVVLSLYHQVLTLGKILPSYVVMLNWSIFHVTQCLKFWEFFQQGSCFLVPFLYIPKAEYSLLHLLDRKTESWLKGQIDCWLPSVSMEFFPIFLWVWSVLFWIFPCFFSSGHQLSCLKIVFMSSALRLPQLAINRLRQAFMSD